MRVRFSGLGLVAGAVLQGGLAAQQPADTLAVPRDTAGQVVDTLRTAGDTVVRRDTVKAPLARAELPRPAEVSGRYHWTRDELFVAGGLTLLELLERVPGVTAYRSGWLSAPAHVTWLGGAGRLRVFYDGVEIISFDEASGDLLDLGVVQLWTLEEVLVERGASELRVYLRSWRVERTTTASRTDIMTGDQDTNLYRGFIGRRFAHGEAAQGAFQQYGTTELPNGGGDELALLGRLGWAARGVSVDAFGIRARRQRNVRTSEAGYVIPRRNTIRRDTYARVGWGDPDRGGWAQVMLAAQAYTRERIEAGDISSLDTMAIERTRNQLVAAAGWRTRVLSSSLTSRTLSGEGGYTSVAGRLAADHRLVAVSAYGEYRTEDSASFAEVAARFTPTSFLSIGGVAEARRPGTDGADTRYAARAEAAIRVRDLWFTGGLATIDSQRISPPIVFDSTFIGVEAGPSTALFGMVRGRFWRAIYVDVFAWRWQEQAFYRPQLQARSEVYLRTRWLRKFPSGAFGILLSARHEYRDGVSFPRATGPLVSRSSHEFTSLLEIRIVDAILFWRQRYGLGQQLNELVPGYLFPRQTTLYGVRWDFWN